MRKKIIYFGAILLSFLLLAAGYLYVSRNGSPFGVKPEGQGNYFRCKITSVDGKTVEESEYSVTTTYNFTAVLKSGPDKGKEIHASQNINSDIPFNPRPVSEGDSILVYETIIGDSVEMTFAEYIRSDALIILSVLFCAALAVFGSIKGLKTLVTLLLTLGAVFFVMVPAILNGENIYIFCILICLYITAMTLTIVNGISHMSLVGGIGCIGGVLVSALITFITDRFIHLTGVRDESDIYLMYINGNSIDLKALVFAGILIGSLGAVMDVSVNIAASLHEVAAKIEKPSFRELYKSGITISRDIIGTMSNTLILAYIGSSLCTVLLIIYNNSFSPIAMFNKESFVTEILNILIGSFGILSALPLTSAIAALFYSKWDKSIQSKKNEICDNNDKDEYIELLKSIDKEEIK